MNWGVSVWKSTVTPEGRQAAAAAILRLSADLRVPVVKVLSEFRSPTHGSFEHLPWVPDCAMLFARELEEGFIEGMVSRYLKGIAEPLNGD